MAARACATILLYWLAMHAFRGAPGGGPLEAALGGAPCRAEGGLTAASAAAREAWDRIPEDPDPLALERCERGLPDALAEAAAHAPSWGALSLFAGELAAAGLGGFPRISDPHGPGGPLVVSWGGALALGAASEPEVDLAPEDFFPLDWASLSERWGPGRAARGTRRAAARFAEAVGGRGAPLDEARARVRDAAARAFPRAPGREACAELVERVDPSRRERRFAEALAANLGSPASSVARRELARLRLPAPIRAAVAGLDVGVRGDDEGDGKGDVEPLVPGSIVSLAAARARSPASRPPGPAYDANAFSDRAARAIRVLPGLFFGPGAGAERLRLAIAHEVAHAVDSRACDAGLVPCGPAWRRFLARFPGDEAFADWFALHACGPSPRCARAARAAWCSEDPRRASVPASRSERMEDAARAFLGP